ncbi:type II toxin-antitoxin system VapC family toxin [Candidatus Poribacteria bacterium]|nr:type II toxin-antitoxin system VapC family toxin [Candidatus Poribacteria bacterium]
MKFQIFDSSVLIPWFRGIAYEDLVNRSLQNERFLLCTVVWMELYAGTPNQSDKRELDRIERALSRADSIISPQTRDFYLAGQMISYYSRPYGEIKPRDHVCDVLIALCAANFGAELVTENAEHMQIWQRILARSGQRLNLYLVSRV